jgi:hypothetical protein
MVSGARIATHKGEVLTKTTELATVVYSRDEIQVAKCTARKMPARTASKISRRVKDHSSLLWRWIAKGARIREAKVRRQAAITRDETASA